MINVLIISGFLANLAAYGNFYSTLFFITIWGISNLTIMFCFSGREKNTAKELSILIICLMYFFSGIIEIFIVQGFNPIASDAFNYFRMASDANWGFRSFISEGLSSGYSSDNITGFKEDFLPILIWNKIYSSFYSIGFPKGRYIGLASNTLFLVWTSFIGLSILRSIKVLNNNTSEKYYKLLFCTNTIFWMYGSILLRESIIIFIISILLKVWIDWIHKKSFFNLIKLGIISTSFYFIGDFLRGGYQNILFIFIISFLTVEIYKIILEKRISYIHFLLLIFIVSFCLIRYQNIFEIFATVEERFTTYNYVSSLETDVGSFGAVLIGQPVLIRMLLSGFFLLITPIPFWAGIVQENSFSFYQFYKSTFAIYNYFTIPLLAIVIKESIKKFRKLETEKLFLLSLLVQIILFIGLTSTDTRHFGNFGIIYILLICHVDFNSSVVKIQYKYLLGYMLLLIFLLYFVYSILKFKSLFISLIFILVPLIIKFFLSKEARIIK